MNLAVSPHEYVQTGPLRSVRAFTAVVAVVAVAGRGKQPKVAPAALAREIADTLDRRLRHDDQVDALRSVQCGSVQAVENGRAHRAGLRHFGTIHEAVDN